MLARRIPAGVLERQRQRCARRQAAGVLADNPALVAPWALADVGTEAVVSAAGRRLTLVLDRHGDDERLVGVRLNGVGDHALHNQVGHGVVGGDVRRPGNVVVFIGPAYGTRRDGPADGIRRLRPQLGFQPQVRRRRGLHLRC